MKVKVIHIGIKLYTGMELRMKKSAEKWGPGGLLRPLVGLQGATPLVGVRGRSPLKLKLKLFNKNKT